MKRMATVNLFLVAAVLCSGVSVLDAGAQDIQGPANHVTTLVPANAGGGLTHYTDGDFLTITSDFVSGPALVRVDANGDGIPANGSLVLAGFDTSAFGNFVQMSPSGAFALAGLSGSDNTVYRIEAATHAVSAAFTAIGNYDLTFAGDTAAYLSASPGGFDPSKPNEISFVDLSGSPVLTPVVQISNTPSGPVALNSSGDLYYIKSTFAFPPPPNSSRLLRFSAAKLAAAKAGGPVLTEADSDIDIALPGGYDLVFHKLANGGELFISTIGDSLLRVGEDTLTPTVFLTVNDPTFPALTAVSLLKPEGPFEPFKPSQSELAVSLSTDFFSKFSVLKIRTDTFDSDGDNFIDAVDQCPADGAKLQPGTCGCGAPEADINADGIVDCGVTTSFSTQLSPRFGAVLGGKGTVTVLMESVQANKPKWSVELRGPDGRNKKKSKSSRANSVTFSRLKPGIYLVTFRISSKVGRHTERSAYSQTVSVQVF